MSEIYGGGSRSKYISPGKVKKFIKKMKKSYKIGDKIRKKEEEKKEKEILLADEQLDKELNDIDLV